MTTNLDPYGVAAELGLVKIDAERAIVQAVIDQPELLPSIPGLAVDDMVDPLCRIAFAAIRNLDAAGKAFDRALIVQRLEQEHGVNTAGANAVSTWLGAVQPICLDAAAMSDLVVDVIGAAKARRAEAEREAATQREEDEVSDVALRDCEPDEIAPTASNEVEPFEQELAKALVDVRARLNTSASGKRQPLFGIDGVDLLTREYPAASWLVTGLITRGGVTVIGAEPKAAKTWMGTEIALGVATGTKVFDEFFSVAGVVAYFYAEDLERQVRNRTRALLAGHHRTLARGRYHPCPRGTNLDITKDDDLAWIVASARRLGQLDLLVLDPLRDIHSGEEDKSDSMRDVMRRLRVLADVLNCTVAVIHHAPKSTKDNAKRRPGQNLRGSSAIHGAIDSGLYLEDSGGDETTLFTNTVISQVKGARSSGRFNLELRVDDDEHGEASCARWTVSRELPGKGNGSAKGSAKERDRADDKAVLAWVCELATRGVQCTRTLLRSHPERPVAEKRVTAALDRLAESRTLVLHESRFYLPLAVQPPGSPSD